MAGQDNEICTYVSGVVNVMQSQASRNADAEGPGRMLIVCREWECTAEATVQRSTCSCPDCSISKACLKDRLHSSSLAHALTQPYVPAPQVEEIEVAAQIFTNQ